MRKRWGLLVLLLAAMIQLGLLVIFGLTLLYAAREMGLLWLIAGFLGGVVLLIFLAGILTMPLYTVATHLLRDEPE